jgi:hypothetical protein
MDYRSKIITVAQALKLVKSGDVIVSGMMAAEGREFLSHLHEIDPHQTGDGHQLPPDRRRPIFSPIRVRRPLLD